MAMSDKDMKIAIRLKERVAEVTALVDFKVFGSRTRGNADEYSDLDVFIELEEANKEIREKIFDIAWEVGFDNDCMLISPLVFSRQEIETSALRSSSIVKAIAAEGVRI
jgi:predicted nucleotidyltransferase